MIANWIALKSVKRRRPRVTKNNPIIAKPWTISMFYAVFLHLKDTYYLSAKNIFLHLTRFKPSSLNEICKAAIEGRPIKENRGGCNKKSRRVYLDSELSITKLYNSVL